jgi:hypothetical protein
MSLQDIFASLQHLDAQQLDEVETYLARLRQLRQAEPLPERQADLHPGVWMSDDFSEELPDEFWGWDEPLGNSDLVKENASR